MKHCDICNRRLVKDADADAGYCFQHGTRFTGTPMGLPVIQRRDYAGRITAKQQRPEALI